MRYFNRQGKPITTEQWRALLERKDDYRRIAQTTLPDGTWISTVWLGLNHRFDSGPPLIFETMVFESENGPYTELYLDRYSTEEEALAGHEAAVKRWSNVKVMKKRKRA